MVAVSPVAVTYEATFHLAGRGGRKRRKQASQKAPERRGSEKVRNNTTLSKPEASKQVGRMCCVCDNQADDSNAATHLWLALVNTIIQ